MNLNFRGLHPEGFHRNCSWVPVPKKAGEKSICKLSKYYPETKVPTLSPETTRKRVPGVFISKTIMGS